MSHVPTLFVSSTCYDLRQVRANLEEFVQSLGLEPFLSELGSFPVAPGISAVENCLKVVDEKADLFVLIVGSRYGTAVADNKSVTNLEYLHAKAKGIPIYVFVQKSVLEVLPVWRDNPEGDFKRVVDSPSLFAFVDSLCVSIGQWVFAFEVAQDITRTLRTQLAYLFMDLLTVRHGVDRVENPALLTLLDGRSRRLLVEQPRGWEPRLFAWTLERALEKVRLLRTDLENNFKVRDSGTLSDGNFSQVMPEKTNELQAIVDAFVTLGGKALKEAFSGEGAKGSPEAIVYLAERLARIYERAIEFSLEMRGLRAQPIYQGCIDLLAGFAAPILSEIEEFPEKVERELDRAIREGCVANVNVVFRPPEDFAEKFQIETDKVMRYLRQRGGEVPPSE